MTNWNYTTTTATSTTTMPTFVFTGPSTLSITPNDPPQRRPKTPLEWLRDEVDEVCRLAAAP